MAEKLRSQIEEGNAWDAVEVLRKAITDGNIYLKELIFALTKDQPKLTTVDEPTSCEVTMEAKEEVEYVDMCLNSLNEHARKLRRDFGCTVNFIVDHGTVKMKVYENKILSDNVQR